MSNSKILEARKRAFPPRQTLTVRNGGLTVGCAGPDITAVREICAKDAKRGAEVIDKLTKGLDPTKSDGTPIRSERALTFDSVALIPGNLRALQERLEDVKVTTFDTQTRSTVQPSAFPVLLSGMSNVRFRERFDGFASIVDQLVTDVDDPNDVLTVAAILDETRDHEEVKVGEEFPMIGAGQEKYSILNRRNGRQIALQQELIDKANVAEFARRIDNLAEIARELLEKQGIQRIYDLHGSQSSATEPYVLRRNNSGATLYSTTAIDATRVPSATELQSKPLTDTTDLDAVREHLAKSRNEKGFPIVIGEPCLVVPDALLSTALKLVGSEMTPAVFNELNPWGPGGRFTTRVMSSPYIDAFIDTTSWLYGDLVGQFVRHWALRPEFVFRSGPGTDAFLRTREGYRARVAWDMEIGAVGFERVVRCLATTTQPSP